MCFVKEGEWSSLLDAVESPRMISHEGSGGVWETQGGLSLRRGSGRSALKTIAEESLRE